MSEINNVILYFFISNWLSISILLLCFYLLRKLNLREFLIYIYIWIISLIVRRWIIITRTKKLINESDIWNSSFFFYNCNLICIYSFNLINRKIFFSRIPFTIRKNETMKKVSWLKIKYIILQKMDHYKYTIN